MKRKRKYGKALWTQFRKTAPKKTERRRKYEEIKPIWFEMPENKRCYACGRKPVELHHFRGRAGTLLHDIRFFMALCSRCHTWVHQNISDARACGLICKSGWNSMRQPKEYELAYRSYLRSKKLGVLMKNEKEPDYNQYDLSEWEASQIKKAIDAEK